MRKHTARQSPARASFDQLCRMPRDNHSTKLSWAIVDGSGMVTLANQKSGEASTGKITMSCKDLAFLARWFLKRVPMKPKAKESP
jgi:hypothetical protein